MRPHYQDWWEDLKPIQKQWAGRWISQNPSSYEYMTPIKFACMEMPEIWISESIWGRIWRRLWWNI